MNKIKIAIDSGTLKSGDSFRGIGFHTKNLFENLKEFSEVDVELVDAKNTDLSRYDMIHYQKFHPYFFSFPFFKQTKSVITIHDLIYLIYPKNYPAGIKGKIRFIIQKLLLKQMDAVITISETSKKDICRLLGVSPERVFVTYLAAGDGFKQINDTRLLNSIKKKYSLPDKFVLYVGDVNYNKNLGNLAEACKMIDIPLVIVGKQAASNDFDRKHPENKPLVRFLEKYGEDKDIRRIGYVSDEDLPLIFNLASVYCQPSLYEGFGLPVVQAFASGVPVVASRTQCLVEIGSDAALYADPKDVKDFSEKIKMVLEDSKLKDELVQKGFKRAKDFSWEKTARKTLEVYKYVLGDKYQ